MKSVIIPIIISALFLISCTKPNKTEELSPILEKYLDYWNTGKFEGIDKILLSDFELRMTPDFKPEKGIETFKETVIKWRTAYPDFHINVNELVFDSDKIAVLWTITATNTGLGSHPPTGKHIKVMGMSIIHFEKGKLKDEWIASNNMFWMTQLGYNIVPPNTVSKE